MSTLATILLVFAALAVAAVAFAAFALLFVGGLVLGVLESIFRG